MKMKRLMSCLTSLALAFTGIGAGGWQKLPEVQAAGTEWRFDLGGNGAAGGYTGVSASDGYNASRGYGFAQTWNVSNASAAGSGALSDAVQFNSGDSGNTFNVDLPLGLYEIKVVTGNTSRTTIKLEGMLQMINLTGNNAAETVRIPVTDGQLNVQAVAGRDNTPFTISAVEIKQLNTTGDMKPTVWICGDSTVANYYNCADTSQHGWGQFLGSYIDSGWDVRNLAASGQYAKGFVEAGQFAPIEYYGKSGDIYLIAIGINDTNYSNQTEYYETVTDMVKKAKAKGMKVALVKQQGRRGDLQRSPLLSGRWFGGQLDTIGREQGVDVIDLFTPWQNFGVSVGYDGMAEYYAIQANGSNDDLHQSMKGAKKLAEIMSQIYSFDGSSAPALTAEELDETAVYAFRNVNSGGYMEFDGSAASRANIQQYKPGYDLDLSRYIDDDMGNKLWKVKSAGDGYYYIMPLAPVGEYLDVSGSKPNNGQNIGLYSFNGNDNQKFMFTKNEDGSYKIRTKISGGQSAVEVADGSTADGANVQQWEVNGANCQDWQVQTTDVRLIGRLAKLVMVTGNCEYLWAWSIVDYAEPGTVIYGDSSVAATEIPSYLVDAEQIVAPTGFGNGRLEVMVSEDVTVYAASDGRAELNGFTQRSEKVKLSNGTELTVYSRDVNAGQTFSVNAPGCPIYIKERESAPPVTEPAAPDIVYGDANCDGRVTIADAAAILQFLGNGDKFPLSANGRTNADVVGNDGITTADALFIQKCLAGLETLPTYTPPATTTTTSTTTTTRLTTTTDPRYFAVDQVWDYGTTETVNAGYTKTEPTPAGDNVGYVNLDNKLDSSITFMVNVKTAGNYMTHIRFANGSVNDRKMKIYVNRDTNSYWMQSFPTTGDWTTWVEYGIVLPLNAGRNTIQFVSATSEGGPNLDYITLTITDEPYAETYDPNSNIGGGDGSKPTIYLAGDSTVQSYRESYAPQQGWGYYLGDYFDSDVTVVNHSIAGRSSKKFYDEGRWQTILDNLKAGDYVMIQFAINDAGSANADRYAPTCGNVDNPSSGSYEWYMTEFIKTAKEKGATPILVTTTINMKAYSNGRFNNSYDNYCDACKGLARKYSVPCIDLNSLMVSHYNSIGYDRAVKYHLMGVVSGSTDGTHFCEEGAKAVAGLVANDVKSQGISGLSGHVK